MENKFDPTEEITTLNLHPYDSDTGKARFAWCRTINTGGTPNGTKKAASTIQAALQSMPV